MDATESKNLWREVPLLSRGRRSGLSRSGKTEKTGREGGRGGRGGRVGGGGGGGEGGGGGGGGARILALPSHKQPKSIGGGDTSPPDLGARLWVDTEGPPPPPPRDYLGGWG